MIFESLYDTFNRYRTLQTDTIYSLPIVILMPHSSCNCRCVMCDIWKANQHLQQLTEKDIEQLLAALKKFNTKQVLMSGGEALLHPGFFGLCRILKSQGMGITLLSTGLTVKHYAEDILTFTDELIVSIDGDYQLHDKIRNIPGAFEKLKKGVELIKLLRPGFPVSGRTVIHQLNYRQWPAIIDAAREMGLDRISFLPADISSQAFNRETKWDESRQQEVLIHKEELPELKRIIETLITEWADDFTSGFIAESPDKLRKIYGYYAAHHGLNDFPYKKCNAPWVSAVIEPDGSVRPCFFHDVIGNIRQSSLGEILNGEKGITFRKELDMAQNDTCKKCVCYLHLGPQTNPAGA